MGVTSLLGPAVGGVAVSLSSPSLVVCVAAIASCLAAACVGAMRRRWSSRSAFSAPLAHEPTAQPRRQDGAPAARDRPSAVPIRVLVAVGVVAALLSIDEPAFFPYTEQALGGSPADYGAILAVWGAGIIVGSLLLACLAHRSMLRVALVGAGVVAISYVGFAAAPSVAVALAVAICGGVGNGLDWTAIVTALQERTPPGLQGKLASQLEAVMAFGPPTGYLAGGLVADRFGPRAPFVVGGVATVVVLAGAALRVQSRSITKPAAERDAPIAAA